jgi:hypothetical protein
VISSSLQEWRDLGYLSNSHIEYYPSIILIYPEYDGGIGSTALTPAVVF